MFTLVRHNIITLFFPDMFSPGLLGNTGPVFDGLSCLSTACIEEPKYFKELPFVLVFPRTEGFNKMDT